MNWKLESGGQGRISIAFKSLSNLGNSDKLPLNDYSNERIGDPTSCRSSGFFFAGAGKKTRGGCRSCGLAQRHVSRITRHMSRHGQFRRSIGQLLKIEPSIIIIIIIVIAIIVNLLP